jgi:NADPH-dependent glutamate synthase beta subunit-like oxidoreductase/coenzyme F420-reducing hydrogenase delta subunit/NAD-dependent dihydropyrimidine dehydrogenase PreA subunit
MIATEQIKEILERKGVTILFDGAETKGRPVGLVEPSPCTRACPAGVNVKAYVSLIAASRFQDALEVVRQRNPLPGICGRVCTHPCEEVCNLGEIDSPVALKRFVADWELAHPQAKPKPIKQTRKEKIAIVGSGPAGLAAANDLIRQGYGVTVFEALPTPGGMLVAGIPSYRLPRDIVKIEIDAIKQLGVKIKTKNPVKGEKAIDRLFEDGFDAVFLAIGAHQGRKLGVPGEDEFEGIIDCVTFLNEVNLGKAKKPGDKVIVIGGGSSAVDSVRTALRLGSEKAHIVYRRSRKEMPAHDAEITEAEREGVELHYLAAPVRILGENGKVTGMECQKMRLGPPDESGRRRPIPIEGSEFVVEADTIITAISQSPDLSSFGEDQGVGLTRWKTFMADEETMATSRPGVFAGGDAVTGPSTVINAIAAGHIAARSIVRWLDGEALIQDEPHGEMHESEIKVDQKQREHKKRAQMPAMDLKARRGSFEEVDLGFDEAQALAEAQRCLRCGPCNECVVCVPDCDKYSSLLTLPDGTGDILFRIPKELKSQISADKTQPITIKAGRKQVPLQVVPLIPWVRQDLCRGCGDCAEICENKAISLVPKGDDIFIASVDPDICRGCQTCVSVCDTGAMTPGYYTGEWIAEHLRTLDPERKNVIVFACHWNGSHVDEKMFTAVGKNSTHVEVIHSMCTGRLNPGFIFQALESGADGVLITGCGSDDCHFDFGATQAQKTYTTVEKLLHMIGVDSQRVQYRQIPKADAAGFAGVVNQFIGEMGKKKTSRKVLVS